MLIVLSLWAGNLLIQPFTWNDVKRNIRWIAIVGVVNTVGGWILFIFFKTLFSVAWGMVAGGLAILISGLKWLNIFNHDIFLIFNFFSKSRYRNYIIETYVVYVSLLMVIAQLALRDLTNFGLFYFAELNLLLAGILLLLMSAKEKWNAPWLKDLWQTLTGIFLLIISLIIMSGDTAYFLHVFEQILHSIKL